MSAPRKQFDQQITEIVNILANKKAFLTEFENSRLALEIELISSSVQQNNTTLTKLKDLANLIESELSKKEIAQVAKFRSEGEKEKCTFYVMLALLEKESDNQKHSVSYIQNYIQQKLHLDHKDEEENTSSTSDNKKQDTHKKEEKENLASESNHDQESESSPEDENTPLVKQEATNQRSPKEVTIPGLGTGPAAPAPEQKLPSQPMEMEQPSAAHTRNQRRPRSSTNNISSRIKAWNARHAASKKQAAELKLTAWLKILDRIFNKIEDEKRRAIYSGAKTLANEGYVDEFAFKHLQVTLAKIGTILSEIQIRCGEENESAAKDLLKQQELRFKKLHTEINDTIQTRQAKGQTYARTYRDPVNEDEEKKSLNNNQISFSTFAGLEAWAKTKATFIANISSPAASISIVANTLAAQKIEPGKNYYRGYVDETRKTIFLEIKDEKHYEDRVAETRVNNTDQHVQVNWHTIDVPAEEVFCVAKELLDRSLAKKTEPWESREITGNNEKLVQAMWLLVEVEKQIIKARDPNSEALQALNNIHFVAPPGNCKKPIANEIKALQQLAEQNKDSNNNPYRLASLTAPSEQVDRAIDAALPKPWYRFSR